MLFTEYGIILSYYTKNENRILNFLYGFLLLIGINHIILTPCILLHTSFSIPFYITIITDIILIIASFFIPKIKYKKVENISVTIITAILIVTQLIFVTIFYKSNADDSFYVSLSETSINSESIYKEEPSMGYQTNETLLSATEQLPSIELQIAIFSKLANVNSAIMCHFILPAIIVFISYLALYVFAKSFMDDKNAKIFLIVLSVIFLFTGFSTKYRAGCLLIKPWQGKAIFLNIAVPMIIANLITIDKELKKRNIILLLSTNLFSMALSSTAIFLVPFIYFPFGILKLMKRKWKDIVWLIVSFVPVIICVLIYIGMNQNVEVAFDVPKENVSIIQSLEYYNSYIYIGYYIIATIVILFMGDKQAKRYFCYVQLINLLTIWNPLFSNLIAKYFTSSAIFWRVLWLLPIEFSIAYAVILITKKTNKKLIKIILFFACLGLLMYSGVFVYSSFKFIENLENIPQSILNQTNYIIENSKQNEQIIVLALPEPLHSTTMRQVNPKIKLINSRELYIEKIKDKQEIEERRNLSQIYFGNYVYNTQEFNEILKKQSVDWVIIDKNDINLINYIEKSNLQRDIEIDGCILYEKASNL